MEGLIFNYLLTHRKSEKFRCETVSCDENMKLLGTNTKDFDIFINLKYQKKITLLE